MSLNIHAFCTLISHYSWFICAKRRNLLAHSSSWYGNWKHLHLIFHEALPVRSVIPSQSVCVLPPPYLYVTLIFSLFSDNTEEKRTNKGCVMSCSHTHTNTHIHDACAECEIHLCMSKRVSLWRRLHDTASDRRRESSGDFIWL